MGSLRSVAQTISYEVSFAVIILRLVSLVREFCLSGFSEPFKPLLAGLALPLGLLWFISALAETSRTPFDFSEGESELVSGFNTEYRARLFTLFFLAEYSSVLFISAVFYFLFLRSSLIFFIEKAVVVAVLYIFL